MDDQSLIVVLFLFLEILVATACFQWLLDSEIQNAILSKPQLIYEILELKSYYVYEFSNLSQ